MAINPTQEDYELIGLRNRVTKIKIELLNFNFQILNLFEGKVVSGTINIDATADIRRTCSLTMELLKSERTFSEGSETWLNKYFRVYVGEYNPRTKRFVWWNMGIFLINNPSRVYDQTTNELTFEGLDLMAKMTGKRNGQLPAVATKVPKGSRITEVVRKTITQLGGFSKYVIEENEEESRRLIPYDITMSMGSTVYQLLAEVRDLYSDWEMFFDVDGVFHWQPIPKGERDPVILDFDQLSIPLVVKDTSNVDFENVKNNIIVYGRLLNNGHQVSYSLSENREESPFSIDKIGQINYIVNDERIYSDDLARQRASYELWLHSNTNDTIGIETVPIYWLNDVNIKIKYTNIANGISGEHMLKNISIPLGTNGTMSLSAYKIYTGDPSSLLFTYPVVGTVNSTTQTYVPETYNTTQPHFSYYTERGE